jgi:hypothetical protein
MKKDRETGEATWPEIRKTSSGVLLKKRRSAKTREAQASHHHARHHREAAAGLGRRQVVLVMPSVLDQTPADVPHLPHSP